jgi:Squalene/phytoene synthase
MSTVVDFDAPTSARPNSGVATDPLGRKDDAITFRPRAAGSSFFWAMQLLPYERREAMYALYDFCRAVDDIADGDASRSLKQTLLLNWRSEIALLYSGRPQHAVTRGLNKAIHLYSLRCGPRHYRRNGNGRACRYSGAEPRRARFILRARCRRRRAAVGADLRRGDPGRRASCSRTRARITAHQHTSRPRRRCPTAPALSAARATAGAQHFCDHAELGAGAAGASGRLSRPGCARRRTLRGCRRGNRSLSSSDNAPGRCDARYLSGAPPRAARARLAAPRGAGSRPRPAEACAVASSRVGGALRRRSPSSHLWNLKYCFGRKYSHFTVSLFAILTRSPLCRLTFPSPRNSKLGNGRAPQSWSRVRPPRCSFWRL